MFGPHAIGTERFPTVTSGSSFTQVAGAILQKQARLQNPDKDEVGGSTPPRPTKPALTSGTPSFFLDSADFYASLVSDERRRVPPLSLSPNGRLTSTCAAFAAPPDACAQSHSGRRAHYFGLTLTRPG